MANKYIRHGETFNGDGTSSAAATSNGGVGAWNTKTYFEGTAPAYGAIAAGDTIFIRSKDAAGADLSLTSATGTINLGSAAATLAAPIKWILDDGVVWTGISGTLTYKRTGNATHLLRAFNTLACNAPGKLIFADEYAGNSGGFALLMVNNGCVVVNPTFDFDNVTFTSVGGLPFAGYSDNNNFSLINPIFNMGNRWYPALVQTTSYSKSVVVNPVINLSVFHNTYPLFQVEQYGAACSVYGGSASGAGSVGGIVLALVKETSSGIVFHGTTLPADIIERASVPTGAGPDAGIGAFGIDGGMGAYRIQRWGYADSRNDGNYPVLNGMYANSTNTGWAWKIRASNPSVCNMIELPMQGIYTETAAVKTVTLDLLVGTNFDPNVTKANLWMDVCYTDDATGQAKYVTTLDITSTSQLDASTAPWIPSINANQASYGAVTLNKRKLSVTTPTAIKKDTMVIACLRGTAKAASASLDLIFTDSDPQLS